MSRAKKDESEGLQTSVQAGGGVNVIDKLGRGEGESANETVDVAHNKCKIDDRKGWAQKINIRERDLSRWLVMPEGVCRRLNSG